MFVLLTYLLNEYQRKLGSKRAYHAIKWPRIRGLAASAGVRLRAKETEISIALWALRLGKGLYSLLTLTSRYPAADRLMLYHSMHAQQTVLIEQWDITTATCPST